MTDVNSAVQGIQRDAIAAGAALPPDIAHARAQAAVPALTLGKAGDTIQTPDTVSFTGAAVTVWTEPMNDSTAIGVIYALRANVMLTKRFEIELKLADKAAWAVIADASVTGSMYPHTDHTVTLLRFNWDGTVTVMAIINGHQLPSDVRPDGVPDEVWDRVKANWDFYCWPHSRNGR